ncbi:hypothetical protein [Chryseobacterium sp.]|uniref:hypothetical protein n=1 Tax=Chryseobacterium sp. TaxID=1871047 RepID=UPI0025C485A5|nr:hypothetical protein [Chryseobacterium sp.]
MNNTTLPTDDLKKYGIIEADNSFSKKLSADDIQKFLQGYTIVADNNKSRITFRLTDNNTQLNVNLYERDKNLSEVLEKSKHKIQYSDTSSQYNFNDEKNNARPSWTKTAFIFDEKTKSIIELNMIKDSKLLTEMVLEKQNPEETFRYKNELEKLKLKLLEKISQYPEIAKEITIDLNIVDNEINAVNSIFRPAKQMQKEGKDDIQLNVNDPDMYEDVNQQREEEQEQEEKWHRPKGRGR